MSNMIIVQPLPVPVIGGNFNAAANVLTPDPKEVAVAPNTGSYYIDVDLGAVQQVDSFFLGFANAVAGSTWALQVKDAFGGATTATLVNNDTLISAGATGPRYHGFHKAPAPLAARYLRFWTAQPAGAALGQVGIVLVGLALQTSWNREWGGGRRPIDTGFREALRGGGFGIGEGARKAAYSWTWGDLTDAEVSALYAMSLDRGETRPLLVVEDPDPTPGLNERLHYGLFTRFEAFERQAPGRTRWSLQVEQWV